LLTVTDLSLFPFPATLNHQFPSWSFRKSPISGADRSSATSSDMGVKTAVHNNRFKYFMQNTRDKDHYYGLLLTNILTNRCTQPLLIRFRKNLQEWCGCFWQIKPPMIIGAD